MKALLPPVTGSVLAFAPPDGDPLRVYVTGHTLVVDSPASAFS